jgi:hypothetical protein
MEAVWRIGFACLLINMESLPASPHSFTSSTQGGERIVGRRERGKGGEGRKVRGTERKEGRRERGQS